MKGLYGAARKLSMTLLGCDPALAALFRRHLNFGCRKL